MAIPRTTDAYAPPGLPGERQDCAVRALAVAAMVPYVVAHGWLAAAGRLPDSATGWGMMDDAIRANVRARAQRKFPGYRMTLARFVREHPRGRYVVSVRLWRRGGHAVAVGDGVLHDWTDGASAWARVRSWIKVS